MSIPSCSPGAQQVQEHSSTIDLPPGKPNASKEQNHMNPVKHQVIVLIGSGAIGQAIARRVGMGKQILLADLREENARAAASTLQEAVY